MRETLQIKKLSCKRDLARLVAGDVVLFGVWEEPALCYDYPGLKKEELFLISRLEVTGIPGGIGVIFDNIDNLNVRGGYLIRENLRTGDLPKTRDGLFHYGARMIAPRETAEGTKEFENPEIYYLFDKALNEAGLTWEKE
jgi:hypothetical protein